MEKRVVFAHSSDGVRVASRVEGTGFPLVVLRVPIASHAGLDPPMPLAVAYRQRLASTHTTVSIDLRGSGLADMPEGGHTFDDYIADIEAILDRLDLSVVDIFGTGMRSPLALRFAARRPERVRRLLLEGLNLRPDGTHSSPMTEPALNALAASNWALFIDTLASRIASSEAHVPEVGAYSKACTDQASYLAANAALAGESFAKDLAALHIPTLVVELEDNTMNLLGSAEWFVSRVPSAELRYVPNKPLFGYASHVCDAIDEWEAQLDASELRSSSAARGALSDRETEVVQLLAGGLRNDEIAAALSLSASTIDRHIANIYAKAGVRNRTEATRWAIAHGIVPPSAST